jgi:hypothetical protein
VRRLLPTLAVAAVVVAGAAPAGAHGDEVQMEVIEQTPSGEGSSVTYLVALTYVGDGEGIDDAVVTATISQTGEAPEAPIPMAPTGAGGGYEATISFPRSGTWNLRFASADPEAGVTTTYRVAAPPPGTASSANPSTTVPPPTSVSVEPTLADDDAPGDDGPPVGLFVGLAVAAVVFIGAAVRLVRGRRDEAT